jgi:hypothetical protein
MIAPMPEEEEKENYRHVPFFLGERYLSYGCVTACSASVDAILYLLSEMASYVNSRYGDQPKDWIARYLLIATCTEAIS